MDEKQNALTAHDVLALWLSLADDDPPEQDTLVCVECGQVSEGDARGRRAFLSDTDEAAVYCPACAAREFGER